ncbi:MAG: hypothetical protein ACPLY9_00120 [Nitrososphaerales archaeon]
MIKNRRMITIGIIVSIIFVIIGCVYLSLSQETLDKVAEEFGLSDSPLWVPPLPDYELPGLKGNIFANIAIGIVSTVLILAFTLAVGKALRARKEMV